MGLPTGLSFTGSNPIVVCDDNHQINRRNIFCEVGEAGKASASWKFGFKLHLIINHQGGILSFCLAIANADDRKAMPDLVGKLTGWFYEVKSNISEKLAELAARERSEPGNQSQEK